MPRATVSSIDPARGRRARGRFRRRRARTTAAEGGARRCGRRRARRAVAAGAGGSGATSRWAASVDRRTHREVDGVRRGKAPTRSAASRGPERRAKGPRVAAPRTVAKGERRRGAPGAALVEGEHGEVALSRAARRSGAKSRPRAPGHGRSTTRLVLRPSMSTATTVAVVTPRHHHRHRASPLPSAATGPKRSPASSTLTLARGEVCVGRVPLRRAQPAAEERAAGARARSPRGPGRGAGRGRRRHPAPGRARRASRRRCARARDPPALVAPGAATAGEQHLGARGRAASP